ncbi:MAG: HlyD family efflux transporter periplasmic adaptor subunit [Phycisphaeraceae bacterium]
MNRGIHVQRGPAFERAARSAVSGVAGYTGPVEHLLPTVLGALSEDVPGSESAVFGLSPEGAPVLAVHPEKPELHRDKGAWLSRTQQLIASEGAHRPRVIPHYNSTGQAVWAITCLVPLQEHRSDSSWGAVCLFLRTDSMAEGQRALAYLQLAAQVIANDQVSRSLAQKMQDIRALSRSMQLLDAVNLEPRFRPAAIALCNQAADLWKASRVSVGFLAGQNVKLRAMSHTEDVSRKMQVVQDLEAAMEECVDQDSEVLVPQSDSATTINRQAKRYVDKHGPCRVCVLPLRLHDDVVGAMAIEWPPDHEIRLDEVEALRLGANLFTARLHQFHMDDRWLGARMATSLRAGAGVVVGSKHTWAKLLAVAVFVFLAFAFFFKGNDTVDAGFTVQTTSRQVITAPFEGTLLSLGHGVEVNDPVVGVEQGDGDATVLALMDTSELRVERASIEAQIADFRAQADAARGEGDLTGVEVALANIRRLQAQADLYDYRIERSTLTSPISGVVIEGDLRQRVNGVLEKGEVLYEVAPLEALRAELLVPASRVGDLRSRLTHPDRPSRGELASVSHPGEFIGFTVERIEPEAEVVDGQNIFRVRVSLDELKPWLRPGVEGEARVHVSRRSYAYLWTRDAVNWARMKLWF